MAHKGWMIAGLSAVLLAPPASAQMRLQGLERLDFDHLAGPGQPLPKSLRIAPLLPETLARPGAAAVKPPAEEDDDWRSSWARMAKVAQCVTGQPGAKITFRKLSAPSE